jgi:hypothetical protein
VSACDRCGATVWWAVTQASGKRIPVDPWPCDDGNLRVCGAAGGSAVVEVLRRDLVDAPPLPGFEFAMLDDRPLYKPHHATCPALTATSRRT